MALSRRQFLAAAPVAAVGTAAVTSLAQSSGGYLRGIDVSRYQTTINWNAVKNSGVTFAIAQATYGITQTDSYFAQNWPAMKAAGLIRGAYHFGHPATDAIAQADHFVNTVKPMKGDLQLVLDFEATDGKTPAQTWAWAKRFINRVKARTGRPCIIYTGFYFWRDSAGNPSDTLNCPLWIAAYTNSTTGLIPSAWNTWTLWQYSSTGTIPGISGNVDRDYFNGSLAQLRALCLPG